jgi:hypothetical protein
MCLGSINSQGEVRDTIEVGFVGPSSIARLAWRI